MSEFLEESGIDFHAWERLRKIILSDLENHAVDPSTFGSYCQKFENLSKEEIIQEIHRQQKTLQIQKVETQKEETRNKIETLLFLFEQSQESS